MVELINKRWCCCWPIGRAFKDSELEVLYQQSRKEHRIKNLNLVRVALVFFTLIYGSLRISAAISDSQIEVVVFYTVNTVLSLLWVTIFFYYCQNHYDEWLFFYSIHLVAFASPEYSQIAQLLNVYQIEIEHLTLHYCLYDWISLLCTNFVGITIPLLDASPYISWWVSVIFSPLYFIAASFVFGRERFTEPEEALPFAMALSTLGLLFFGSLWQQDEDKRRAFVAKRQTNQLTKVMQHQRQVLELLSASVFDATFSLSKSLMISANRGFDDLVGTKANGISITKLLSEPDAVRLKEHAELILSSNEKGLKQLPPLCLNFSCQDGRSFQANTLLVEPGPMEGWLLCGIWAIQKAEKAVNGSTEAKSKQRPPCGSTPIHTDDISLHIDSKEWSDTESSAPSMRFSLCLEKGVTDANRRFVSDATQGEHHEFESFGVKMRRTPSRTPREPPLSTGTFNPLLPSPNICPFVDVDLKSEVKATPKLSSPGITWKQYERSHHHHMLAGTGKSQSSLPKSLKDQHLRYLKMSDSKFFQGEVKNFDDGSRYEGKWLNGAAHGYGRMSHPDGDEYHGQWSKGNAQGEGMYIQKQGSMFFGQWHSDLKDGQGIEEWPDGARYEGAYVEGQKHGIGTFMWPNGSTYRGEFVKDEMHGEGGYAGIDGRCYQGSWVKGQMHGSGQYHYPGLGTYTGQYLQHHRHGQGTFTWDDGSTYEGQWNNDKEHGHGTMTNASGESMIGTWCRGEQVEPKLQFDPKENGPTPSTVGNPMKAREIN